MCLPYIKLTTHAKYNSSTKNTNTFALESIISLVKLTDIWYISAIEYLSMCITLRKHVFSLFDLFDSCGLK